jgi:SAM-dependent methyltransferase
VVQSYAARSTWREAAFFIPHLRPNMNLLDVGSGPGTITIGLAEVLHEGDVVGLELNPEQVAQARDRGRMSGRWNITFQQGSAYRLPFPDMSFDAVFAHALLQHLKDPSAAIAEMRRVLRPNGLVGLRDDDNGSLILAPPSPRMSRAIELMESVMRLSGGDPQVGRTYPRLLRLGGFSGIEMGATTEFDRAGEATTVRGDLGAILLEQMGAKAIEAGLTSVDELSDLIAACREWGRDPDAFDAIIWCEVVARRI